MVAFVAHIAFVNLMVGGSILVFGFQIRGLRDRDFDALARALATTVTVNKSLAVVLGVAPLLLINVLYTIQFYTANALTGTAWILLVPGIATTFLLLYLHKYSWDKLAAQKTVHIAILGVAVLLLLAIPLVFLANVNLMMFPGRWTEVRGFLSSLLLPNVLPRYFHFICASLILTSLFGVWYFGRSAFPAEQTFERLTRPSLRRTFYSVALGFSLLQFVVGPLVLLTLPAQGLSLAMLTTIFMGVGLAIPAVWMMWQEVTAPDPKRGRLAFIVACLSLTVLCMATGRHLYRVVALADHRSEMREATRRWVDDSAQAAYDAREGRARPAGNAADGQQLFQATCSACHGLNTRVVGPSVVEIATLYSGNPDGIVTWARAPGKKRADAPQMPPFASLGDARLRQIALYMLASGQP